MEPGSGNGTRVRIRLGTACDRGIKRPYNEDGTLVLRAARNFGGERRVLRLLAVADGMGGLEAGEVASRLALSSVAGTLLQRLPEIEDANAGAAALRNAFEAANERVLRAPRADANARMGTTLVVACALGDDLFVGNVGDSRCYFIRKGEIERATRDDSLVQQMVDRREITEAEAAHHPRRNEITNAIGLFPTQDFTATIKGPQPLPDYDYLLLCSDGLHGVVSDAGIRATVLEANRPGAAARALVEAAKARGGPDNISVIVARVLPALPAVIAPGTP